MEEIDNAVAEVLEAVWTLEEDEAATLDNLAGVSHAPVSEELLQRLCRDGLLEIYGTRGVRLTANGRELAAGIMRRHRLAERLLCDVLGAQVEDTEDAACEFEHVLAEGIADSICTLLGHPQFCPHNRSIPAGTCCLRQGAELRPIVLPCDQMPVGGSGRIAYVSAREHGALLRLSALGINPGARVRLIQKWPSYVVECEETEIAFEQTIVRNIYVWQERSR